MYAYMLQNQDIRLKECLGEIYFRYKNCETRGFKQHIVHTKFYEEVCETYYI